MLDPLTYWSRLMTGWRMIGDSGARLESTATDSRTVIAARTTTMGEAFQSPLTADVSELSRMVPEKIAAFSLAGIALANTWWKMRADWAAEAQHIAAMMLRARAPTLFELADLSSHSTALGLRTFEAGSRLGRDALAPIHDTAAANTRRLSKGGRA